MATRFYLPSTGSADHEFPFRFWEGTADMDRVKAVSTKGSSSLASKAIIHTDPVAYESYGLRQYSTGPMAAHDFTTSETFSFSVRCMESDAAINFRIQLRMVVRYGADGSSVRGVLYEGCPNGAEFNTALRSISASEVAFQNNVSMQADDHIVWEFAFQSTAGGTGNFTATMNFGEDTANALDLSDTDTDADYPWLEFSYSEADPNVTLPITGVSGTASVGTLVLSATLALSGLVGTAAVDTLAPEVAPPISGIEAAASVGTVPLEMGAVLAGIEAVDALGDTGVSVTIPITGNAAAGEVGTVTRGTTDMPLTGNEGTTAVDDLPPGSTLPLTGNAATGAVGTVEAHIGVGPDITIPITGVSANPAYQLSGVAAAVGVGTVSPNIEYVDIILPITGVGATAAVGDVVYLELGGWAATGEVGNVGPNASPPLTGAEATAAAGDVGQNRSAGLTGTSGNGEAGGWNTVSRAITGNEATGGVGTPTPNAAQPITGNAGTAGVGSVVQSHGVALTGIAAPGVTGYVGTFIAGDVVVPLTGIPVTAHVGTLTIGTPTPQYFNVNPRRRILQVEPRRRIIPIHRRRY